MYDYYGIYSSCRDAAWRCHLDFDIRSLPVKLTAVAKRAGILIHKNSGLNELRDKELGASIFAGGVWHIVYDDRLPYTEARMVLAHELAHIFLGHEYKYTDYRFASGTKKLKSEREADMFAIRLLAPACVLHELGVTDAARIERLCEIPKKAAYQRAARMEVLEKRGAFYKSEDERAVLERFSEYIYSCRASNSILKDINECDIDMHPKG